MFAAGVSDPDLEARLQKETSQRVPAGQSLALCQQKSESLALQATNFSKEAELRRSAERGARLFSNKKVWSLKKK